MFNGIVTKLSEGVPLASAATIAVKADLHRVTGSTAIATITPPNNIGLGAYAAGMVVLVPTDGTLGLLTTGNIAIAVTMAQNRATLLVYSPTTAKWYPGAIS